MVMCFVPDCKHYSEKNVCKSFFSFPRDQTVLQIWIKLIRRKDRKPNKQSRICSCHFEGEDKNNLPVLFARNNFTGNYNRLSNPVTTASKGNKSIRDEESGDRPMDCLKIPIRKSQSGLRNTLNFLEAENKFLRRKLANFKPEKTVPLSVKQLRLKSQHLVSYYTGISSWKIFDTLIFLLSKMEVTYYSERKDEMLALEDQILITLMKLRHNFDYTDLATRFDCSVATISNIVLTWVHALHSALFLPLMRNIPSNDKHKSCLPTSSSNLSDFRMILDCIEIFFEMSKPASEQNYAFKYSAYKQRTAMKALIGVASNGIVTFASRLYPGSMSDKQIVEHNTAMNVFEEGDLVLADKGFLITYQAPPRGDAPSTITTSESALDQVVLRAKMVQAREHVEDAFKRITDFSILSYMPATLQQHAAKIFQVCVALSNMQFPLVEEINYLFF